MGQPRGWSVACPSHSGAATRPAALGHLTPAQASSIQWGPLRPLLLGRPRPGTRPPSALFLGALKRRSTWEMTMRPGCWGHHAKALSGLWGQQCRRACLCSTLHTKATQPQHLPATPGNVPVPTWALPAPCEVSFIQQPAPLDRHLPEGAGQSRVTPVGLTASRSTLSLPSWVIRSQHR